MHIVYTCSGQRVSRYLFVILNGGSCTLCIPVQDSVSVVTCSLDKCMAGGLTHTR